MQIGDNFHAKIVMNVDLGTRVTGQAWEGNLDRPELLKDGSKETDAIRIRDER